MKRVEKKLLASVAFVAFSLGAQNISLSASQNYWDPQNGSTDFFDVNNWTGGDGPKGDDTHFQQGTAFGTVEPYSLDYDGDFNLASRIGEGIGNVADVHIKIVAPYGGNPDGNEISYENDPGMGTDFFLGSDGAVGKLTLEIEGNAIVQNYRTEFISIGSGRDANGTLTLVGTGKNADVIPEGPLFFTEDGCAGPRCGSSFSFGDTDEFRVGDKGGSGLVTIENAATYIKGGSFSIGSGDGSTGTVNILSNGKLGVNSNEDVSEGSLFVGSDGGAGTLNVGDSASALNSRVGASVFVSGSGITLGSGEGSQGQLNIRPNAMAHTLINEDYSRKIEYGDISRSELETRLGVNEGNAKATVTGEGAVWYQSGLLSEDGDYEAPDGVDAWRYISDQGKMYVGVSGEGELIIADKAQVRIGSADMLQVNDSDDENDEYAYRTMEFVNHVADGALILGQETTGTGVLSIGGGIGQGAKAAGRLMAQTLEFGEGKGTVRFNHTENDYVFDRFDSTFLKFTDDGTGNDKLDLKGAGTLDAAAGRTILNEDHLNFTGVVNPTTGTMQVNGDLSAATGKIAKDGALEGIGSIGNVSNAGILAPGRTLNDLHGGDHASIGTFTIKGDYKGENGFIYIDTVLGGDNSETDLLVIEGDTSGNSLVQVTNINGNGAQTNNGIKIIQVDGASNGTFNLKGDYKHEGEEAVVAGAYAYKLHKVSSSQTTGDYYLRSELKPTDPVKPEPLYNAGTPIYEVYPQFLLGLNRLPTLQQRVGNRYWNNDGNKIVAQGADTVEIFASSTEAGSFTQTNGIWGRIESSHNKSEPRFSTSASTYDYNSFKMQAGLDGQLTETENGKLIGGLTAHYSHGKVNIASKHGTGDIKTDGYGLGGTLSWYEDNGFYVDGQGQLAWYRSELYSSTAKKDLADGKNRGFGYALSVEAGQRVTIDERWSVTPQAQLQYSNIDFNDFSTMWDQGGRSDVSLNKGDSLIGRVGLSLEYQNSWQNAQGMTDRSIIYGVANLYNEFLDGTKVDVNRTSFINKSERFWGGIGFGGSYNWANDKYSIYGEGSVNTSFKNFGDSYDYKGTLGLRVKW